MNPEQEINKILKESLAVYFMMEKSGRHDLAKLALSIGSSTAELLITMNNLRESYHKGVYCPQCHKAFVDHDNILSIQKAGSCLLCDHLYMTAEELDYDQEDYDR
jgi:hypothetical protein